MADALRGRILAQSEAWLVLDKPSGLETIVTGGGNTSLCLTSRLRRELGGGFLAPCHRLDRDTTGCQLFALTKDSEKSLTSAFRTRDVKKHYLALCRRGPKAAKGIIQARLSRWSGGGHRPVSVVGAGKGQSAETRYETLIAAEGGRGLPATALLLCEPLTGRTHQIRVHAASVGAPLLGDHQYGDRAANRTVKERTGLARHGLHALRLGFPDPGGKGRIDIEAPPAEDLANALDLLLPTWRERLG